MQLRNKHRTGRHFI